MGQLGDDIAPVGRLLLLPSAHIFGNGSPIPKISLFKICSHVHKFFLFPNFVQKLKNVSGISNNASAFKITSEIKKFLVFKQFVHKYKKCLGKFEKKAFQFLFTFSEIPNFLVFFN